MPTVSFLLLPALLVSAPVLVSLPSREKPVSFRFEVLPALSKQGCSSGKCHGSPSGKGGFRLSLRAFDPELDRQTLLHEHISRRVTITDPDRSLILLKPMGKVPHEGGVRLRTGDHAYEILREWIARGCPVDIDGSAECTEIDVFPRSGGVLRISESATQQLSVRARFVDGSVRDISLLAVYTSSDEGVATVGPDGLVTAHDRGNVAIVVRYLEHIRSVLFTFVKDIEGFVWNDPPRRNFVDTHVHDKLQELRYLPSGPCTDAEFIRRVFLDVTGRLPPVETVKSFLSSSDPAPERRCGLIDTVLEDPGYAQFWALKWGDMLRLTRSNLGDRGAHSYHRWLQHVLDINVPYDGFVRQLLTASGSTIGNPAANYFRASADPAELMETTAQLFLGARLQCAKCHNHPFERWTQDNYYGMSAFFNRIQRKSTSRPDEVVVWAAPSGEVKHPRTDAPVQPWVPVAGNVDTSGVHDRRHALTRWLTRADNPFFARVEVNRIWSHLMGRGIVEPFDDFRDSNPPSSPELLDELARDFVEHEFDRKHVLRTILQSHTYQRSSRPSPFSEEDGKYFSHYRSRMLTAEQLHDAIRHVAGSPGRLEGLPEGTGATQLPSPDVLGKESNAARSFLKLFGQSNRQTVCQCERATDARLGQALQLLNGAFVHDQLRHPASRFRRRMIAGKSNDEIISELYLAAYCRYPMPEELAANRRYVERKSDRSEAFEDVCWAIFNSKEFLFQR